MWGEFGDYVINDYNPLVSFPTINKPIIHLFNGEKFNSKYRQFISDPQNHKKCSSYQEFIENCIEYYEGLNKSILDVRPPKLGDSEMEKVEEVKALEKEELAIE
jgi:hypothetical protein